MATDDIIITDSLNLKIASKIPLNEIDNVFVDLGFPQNEVDMIKAQNQLASQRYGASRELLSSYKNRHGCGLDPAERLKSAMEEHGVTEAVALIKNAIDKVIPSVPRGEPMMTVDMETEAATPATGKPSKAK